MSHSGFVIVAQCRAADCNFNWQIWIEKSQKWQERWRGISVRDSTGLLVFQNRSDTLFAMNKTVIEVQVRAVLPTSGGCAIFLGNPDKVFIIYVDQSVGSAITMFMRGTVKE